MTPQGQKGGRWSARWWLTWLFGASLVLTVVLVASHRAEERAFARLLQTARPIWIVVALVLQAATYVVEARIWRVIALRSGHQGRTRSFVGLAFAKLFIDQAVPSGGWSGTLVVVHALEQKGVPRSHALAGVLVDLAGYYAAYLVALGAAVAILWARSDLRAAVVLPVLLFTAFAVTMILLPRLVARHQPLVSRRLGRVAMVKRLVELVRESDPVILRSWRLVTVCLGLELAIFVLDAATLWTALQAVGVRLSVPAVFAAYMLAALARTIGVVPGGLGTFEAVSVASLRLLGAPVAGALAATLLFRGFSFWLALVPGLIFARRLSRR